MVKRTPVSTPLWRRAHFLNFLTWSQAPSALNCVRGSSVHRRTPATSWIRSHSLASDPPSKRFPGKIQLAQHTSSVWLEMSIQINFSLQKKLLLFKQGNRDELFWFPEQLSLKERNPHLYAKIQWASPVWAWQWLIPSSQTGDQQMKLTIRLQRNWVLKCRKMQWWFHHNVKHN